MKKIPIDRTPVRRQYNKPSGRPGVAVGSGRNAAAVVASSNNPVEEDDDTTKSPANNVNTSSTLQKQVISVFNPNAVSVIHSVAAASPSQATSNKQPKGVLTPTLFSAPKGASSAMKNAPARVKANPVNNPALLDSSASTEPLPGSGNRPSSRQMPTISAFSEGEDSAAGQSKQGWPLDSSHSFEQELQEIGRLSMRNADISFATLMPNFTFDLGDREVHSDGTVILKGERGKLAEGGGGGGGGVDSSPTALDIEPLPAFVDPNLTTHTGRPIHVPYTPDLRGKPNAASSVHTHVPVKPMVMRDYQLLAETCQRAGKARMEGHAYYKMGELLAQNSDTLTSSLKYFQGYLNICRRLNDIQGEAKALNCLGIAYQELGGEENLKKALDFHRQHAEIADAAGIFIANTNMGLIYGVLRKWPDAIMHHKQALQYAVRAGDKQAESLAVANLGLMARAQGDGTTAKVCIERHLELAQELTDEEASLQANEQLGLLAASKGDWEEGANLLTLAMEIAVRIDHQSKTNELKAMIGILRGNLRVEETLRMAAKAMGAKADKKATIRKPAAGHSPATSTAHPTTEDTKGEN